MLGNVLRIDVKVLGKHNNPLNQNVRCHSIDSNQTLAHKSQTYIDFRLWLSNQCNLN